MTTCLVGKGRRPTAAVGVRGSNPVQCCCTVRGRSGGRPVTCDSYSPAVTARAHRRPAVPGAMRIQRGPERAYTRAWKHCQGAHQGALAQRYGSGERPPLTVGDRRNPRLGGVEARPAPVPGNKGSACMGHVPGHRSVVAERYDDEGIAPCVAGGGGSVGCIRGFGEAHRPDGSRTELVSLWGGFTYRATWAFMPGFSCCATSGADE
jgi:hypothetical protein